MLSDLCYRTTTIYVYEPNSIVLVVRSVLKSPILTRDGLTKMFISEDNHHLTSRFCRVVKPDHDFHDSITTPQNRFVIWELSRLINTPYFQSNTLYVLEKEYNNNTVFCDDINFSLWEKRNLKWWNANNNGVLISWLPFIWILCPKKLIVVTCLTLLPTQNTSQITTQAVLH